jgi:K+-transporting ATPase ATPase C chain
MTLVLTILTGVIFPGLIWGISQVCWPDQAQGSLVRDESGRLLGSKLIAQAFARPEYFHPRPSACNYDASNAAASCLSPTNPKLLDSWQQERQRHQQENGLSELPPVDAVSRSGSGLDPDISPANARQQVLRVATARRVDPKQVERILSEHILRPVWGFWGEERVNVLELNRALDHQLTKS